jgi:hypothetical protein
VPHIIILNLINMKNKIIFSLLSLALVFGAIGFTAQTVHAQVAPTFPAGCTSNLGYSVTNGTPCNGTSTATTSINGCTTALGYSTTTAVPCDGNSVAISYLAGCTSIYGDSTISGAACDGTATGTMTVVTTTPALPVTGAGSNVFLNAILLLASLAVISVGSVYVFKKQKFTV